MAAQFNVIASGMEYLAEQKMDPPKPEAKKRRKRKENEDEEEKSEGRKKRAKMSQKSSMWVSILCLWAFYEYGFHECGF